MDNLFGRPPTLIQKGKNRSAQGLNEPHAAVLAERKEIYNGKGPYDWILTDPMAWPYGHVEGHWQPGDPGHKPYGNHDDI